MSFATSLTTKSLKHAAHIATHSIESGSIVSKCLSPMSSPGSKKLCINRESIHILTKSISPMPSPGKTISTPVQAQQRRLSITPKSKKKQQMTVEEVRAALEPITRAREQGLLLHQNLPF